MWVLVLAAACTKDPEPLTPEQQKGAIDGHYLTAQAFYLKGDFKKAHEEFDEVKRLSPSDPRLPAAMGELLLSEGHFSEAADQYRAALKIDPKRATTYSRLGYIVSAKGDHAEGQALFKKALELNPKDFIAWESLANFAYENKDVDTAIADMSTAAEVAPEKMQAEYALKAAKWASESGKVERAVEILRAATSRGVKSGEIFEQLGVALVNLKQFDEAIAAYTEAAKASPKDPTLWEIVGELQFRQGRLKEAETAYKSSLAVADRGVVHVAIARMCRANKMKACIAAELDRALATASGEEPRELLDLADLLESEGRGHDALLLLTPLSEESDQASNTELQLHVARLAKAQKDTTLMTTACQRALTSAKPGTRCP